MLSKGSILICTCARREWRGNRENRLKVHFEGFLRDTNEWSLALRLVLSLTLQPGFALDMTGKRVTAFQASKVRVIESVTVSFDLSLGLCACAMWNTCTDFSLSPLLWVFMHYFGRLCLNYPGLKCCHVSNKKKQKQKNSRNAWYVWKTRLMKFKHR